MADNPYSKYASQNPYAKYARQPEEGGAWDRIKAKEQESTDYLAQQAGLYNQGNLTKPELYARNVSSGIGLANAIAGEGFKKIGEGISYITPDAIEEPVREAGRDVLNYARNTLPGRNFVGAAQELSAAHGYMEQNYPRATEDFDALANIGVNAATLFTPVKGQSLGGAAAQAGGKALEATGAATKAAVSAPFKEAKSLVKGAMARDVGALEASARAIKNRSSASYQQMRNIGAAFTPQTNQQITRDVLGALQGSGVLNKHLHGKIMGITEDFAKEMSSGNIDLESLDQWRRLYADVAGNHLDPDSARKASIIVDAIDDSVDRLTPSNLTSGSPGAVNALKQGRAEWQRYKKFQMVSDIVKKSDGDANYLKRELKKLADNPRKVRGFTVDEVMALKEASTLSASEGIYKMLGKFGIDLGNSRIGNTALPVVGGIAAGAGAGAGAGFALPVVGTVARQAQKYKARSKVESLLKEIEK